MSMISRTVLCVLGSVSAVLLFGSYVSVGSTVYRNS